MTFFSSLFSILIAFSISPAYASDNGIFSQRPIDLYSTAQRSQSFESCRHLFPTIGTLQGWPTSFKTTSLCSNGFAILYSKTSKTPLVAVEKLTRDSVADAQGERRTNDFFADPRLRRQDRSELSDYSRSGYDRGHMAAAANATDPQSMAQTFALSNMIPQDPTLNRQVWSKLERDTRSYAKRAQGSVFVYTGPLFERIQPLGPNQVWIPTHVFKVVYDESKSEAWAWILPNHSSATLSRPISYFEFERISGLKLLNLSPRPNQP